MRHDGHHGSTVALGLLGQGFVTHHLQQQQATNQHAKYQEHQRGSDPAAALELLQLQP